jgi:hypothetical protein
MYDYAPALHATATTVFMGQISTCIYLSLIARTHAHNKYQTKALQPVVPKTHILFLEDWG